MAETCTAACPNPPPARFSRTARGRRAAEEPPGHGVGHLEAHHWAPPHAPPWASDADGHHM
eukprot:5825465-Alexandrium_andersonii.AAC.1